MLELPAIPTPLSNRENPKPLLTNKPKSKRVDIQPQMTQAIFICNIGTDKSPLLRLPANFYLKLDKLAISYHLNTSYILPKMSQKSIIMTTS